MLHITELLLVDNSLIEQLQELYNWINNCNLEPISFRYVHQEAGMLVHVQFGGEHQASALARRFGGRVIAPSEHVRIAATRVSPEAPRID